MPRLFYTEGDVCLLSYDWLSIVFGVVECTCSPGPEPRGGHGKLGFHLLLSVEEFLLSIRHRKYFHALQETGKISDQSGFLEHHQVAPFMGTPGPAQSRSWEGCLGKCQLQDTLYF